MAETAVNNNEIHVYGADWCGDCTRAKAALKTYGADYVWHDIESEDGAAEKAVEISGQKHIPVVLFADGTHFVEPSATDIKNKLEALGMLQ
ncbi:mycoredoxin [Bifidobacterium tsurumiense]|uniref:Glutaredoxin n=1 Tax=Bifidobacterium tsurumiense TaxID=356829 RepID=A0A087E904_9BIFI|nr:mycoredoxin [Bifidobacterium tsurumiense]KFJ04255.1 glutaredoxin [Bifidobacterium tsurumiense]